VTRDEVQEMLSAFGSRRSIGGGRSIKKERSKVHDEGVMEVDPLSEMDTKDIVQRFLDDGGLEDVKPRMEKEEVAARGSESGVT